MAHETAINYELPLTLITEPVYKKYFFTWEGAQPPPQTPHPHPTTLLLGL